MVPGRDENGRFTKGHKLATGRKPRTEEREIIAALDAAIPLAEVLDKLRRAIIRGEDWAIKLYLAYYWHLPTQPVKNDIDGQMKVLVVYDDDDYTLEAPAPQAEGDA